MSSTINNYTELKQRVAQLKSDKAIKEEEIKQGAKELIASIDPVNIIKKNFHRLAEDKELHQDVLKSGLTIAIDFIIEKLFRSNKSIRRFASSLVFEKIITRYIQNHSSGIKSGIHSFLERITSKA